MSGREMFVTSQAASGRLCSAVTAGDSSRNPTPLPEGKRQRAEAAKRRALEILSDALKKKDRVLMEVPQYLFFGERGDPTFWMERHAILTETLVRGLISELDAVTFKEDLRQEIGGKSREHIYAYVYPRAGDRTVYLCPLFWEAPTHLGENSQPGTLIHEVSHFLGVRDLTHSKAGITVACRGKLVKGSSDLDSLGKALQNANNISYEFEMTLNHKGGYENGRYLCCGETAENSVCERAVPDQFLIHYFRESSPGKKSINDILQPILMARDRLQTLVAKLRETAEDINNVHRGATIANITGGAVGIAGGITTVVGLCLAPFTFGASLIVSLTGIAVSTAGGLTSAAASTTDLVTCRVKKRTVEELLKECEVVVEDINKCIKSMHESIEISEKAGNGELMFTCSQIGSGAGRTIFNTIKIVEAGQLLANVSRVARFAGAATGVLTALTLVVDIAFVARESVHLHRGAKPELVAKIQEAANEIEKLLDKVNELHQALTVFNQE